MIQEIHDATKPYRESLATHSLYKLIKSVDDLTIFMSYHVYSVWDFMNLLKSLQAALTCTSVPWRPVNFVENARLINEIVLEEESDVIDGVTTSHFLYYVNALKALSYDSALHSFLSDLNNPSISYESLIEQSYIPVSIQSFLRFTYDVLQSSTIEIASAFAFGRETLVPQLFKPLLHLNDLDPKVQSFISYLDRHIELDGELHGHLAETMVSNLCQSKNDWLLAKNSAINSLKSRIKLWDSIAENIQNQ